MYLPETALRWLNERPSRHNPAAKVCRCPESRGPVLMLIQDKPKGERRAPAKRKATVPKTNGHAKYVMRVNCLRNTSYKACYRKRRTKGRRRKADESDDDGQRTGKETGGRWWWEGGKSGGRRGARIRHKVPIPTASPCDSRGTDPCRAIVSRGAVCAWVSRSSSA